jgi:hypothetical protein
MGYAWMSRYPVNVLRRRTESTNVTTEPVATSATGAPERTGAGKGRPTPKRRDAERARRTPVIAPKNSKEARAAQRTQMREARAGRMRGDERYLTSRDRGPVRGFARDYVDARRNVGGLFMPSAVLILVLNTLAVNFGFLLMLVLILAIMFDSFILSSRVKAEAARRFPDEKRQGVGAYAVMRALQVRRWRIPPPRVQRGQKV